MRDTGIDKVCKDFNEFEEECSEHENEVKLHDPKCLMARSLEELCPKCLRYWSTWRNDLRFGDAVARNRIKLDEEERDGKAGRE